MVYFMQQLPNFCKDQHHTTSNNEELITKLRFCMHVNFTTLINVETVFDSSSSRRRRQVSEEEDGNFFLWTTAYILAVPFIIITLRIYNAYYCPHIECCVRKYYDLIYPLYMSMRVCYIGVHHMLYSDNCNFVISPECKKILHNPAVW